MTLMTFYLALITHFLIIYFVTISNSYNIDTSYPLIIRNNADDGANSFFGTTVLLIDGKDPSVIVGSPRSNSTLSSHRDINEPGVVWQCLLQRSTGSTNACRILVMDPTGNSVDPNRVKVMDRKDNGWLGGALLENSDSFIACSSRWSNQFYENETAKGHYFMNGMCNWRPKNDIFQENLPQISLKILRILPLTTDTDAENQKKNVWGSGQAGFSIHSPPKTKEILIGAPGVQSWKGSVIRMSSEDNFKNVFIFDNTLSSLQLSNDSYFGFAVSSGNFFKDLGSREIQYVSGAPRHKDLKGHVTIFKIPLKTPGDILFEIDGHQIGSYFGSSICVADLNNDGWDDLLIGAPMHTTEYRIGFKGMEQKSLKMTRGYGDEGAVFVYLSNNGNSLKLQTTNFNGPVQWSHFGTSIANLGDIDNDGYPDIAIGAPYAYDGTGAIYIYHGSINGLSKEKSQIIAGNAIDPLLKGFGYSISSGKDIDLNGYNDLAIGAYDSGHVVILRSRPLISVQGTVRSTMKKLPFDTTTFEVESCILYNGISAPQKQDFTIKILADIQSRPQRVFLEFFEQRSGSAEQIYQEELYIGQESCKKFIARVVRPIETSGKPVEIIQQVSISEVIQNAGKTLYSITRFGDRINTAISGSGYQSFCKSCPILAPSNTKLTSLMLPIAVDCGEDNRCISDLRLNVQFVDHNIEDPFMIGTPILTMEATVTNYDETAISPGIIVVWNSRSLKKIPSECQSPSFINETFREVKCSLGRIMEASQFRKIMFEFNMQDDLTAGSLDAIKIQVIATTVSEVKNPDTMSKKFHIDLISKADIFMEGYFNRTKFNVETLSPKTQFLHNYEVILDGPSPIIGALVIFKIPVNVEHTSKIKTKFEIAEPAVSVNNPSSKISCFAETGSFRNFKFSQSRSMEDEEIAETEKNIDPTNLDSTSPLPSDEEVLTGGVLWGKTGRELVVECDSQKTTVKCMTVKCRIDFMNPGTKASIAFSIRVGTDSLKNLFKQSKFTAVKFISSGSSEILGVKEDIQPPGHKPDNTVSIFVIEEDVAKPVPHYIYFLAILIGFIVLGIIICCLCRVGIFERKKKPIDETDKAESSPLQEASDDKGDQVDGSE